MHKAVILLLFTLFFTGGSAAPASSAAPSQGSAANRNPVIDDLVLEYTAIERGGSGHIKCVARDPNNSQLTYKWEVNRGSISGKGARVVYTAPSNYVDVMVNVYISNGRGGWAQKSAAFKVVCCGGHVQKNPDWKP
ncbi:MAG: hypothetical protein FWE89_01855 [Syntrophaceae bacterium]|nr:hypothetical protein [Syntrophaceae bacterium]